jgi:hypothetical protein
MAPQIRNQIPQIPQIRGAIKFFKLEAEFRIIGCCFSTKTCFHVAVLSTVIN